MANLRLAAAALAVSLCSDLPYRIAAQADVSIDVLSARRARTYAKGASELRPAHPDQVVLVVAMRGIPEADWATADLYVTADQERIPAVRRVSISGSGDRIAIFVVPTATARFVLHVAERVSLPIAVDRTIVDNIMLR